MKKHNVNGVLNEKAKICRICLHYHLFITADENNTKGKQILMSHPLLPSHKDKKCVCACVTCKKCSIEFCHSVTDRNQAFGNFAIIEMESQIFKFLIQQQPS